MSASFKSDYYLLRGYLKTLLGVYGFLILLSVVQKNAYMTNFYAAFLSVYMPYTLFSLSQQSGWDTMLLSAPVSRRAMVGGRYAMCLAIDSVMLLVSLAISSLIEPKSALPILCSTLFTLAIVLTTNAILIPAIYQFGVHHARFLLLVLCLLPALALPLSDYVDFRPLANTMLHLLSALPMLLLLCTGAALLLGFSFLLSCAIYRRKEF